MGRSLQLKLFLYLKRAKRCVSQQYLRFGRVHWHQLVLGLNFRAYDAKNQTWNMKWLNGLNGTWTDLGDPKLGGVHVDEKSIWYILKESLAHHALTRATYTNISPDHFTWRGERSSDGKIWEEFLIVHFHRAKD